MLVSQSEGGGLLYSKVTISGLHLPKYLLKLAFWDGKFKVFSLRIERIVYLLP